MAVSPAAAKEPANACPRTVNVVVQTSALATL
jgi:hypothetical protein